MACTNMVRLRGHSGLVLYLHGFNSAPASRKARLLAAYLARAGEELVVPALPYGPARAVAVAEAALRRAGGQVSKVVGSSLGGYYATHLAEKYGLKAALINPAVRPYALLGDYLGPQRNLYTGERYTLTPAHVDELRALEVPAITRPGRYLLLVQTGDEVLDYREAVEKYRGAKQIVEAGGDHAFQGFENYLEAICSH